MTALEAALREITSFLDSDSIPYMVIGGIANLVWGVPRATLDIDLTLWAPAGREESLAMELARRYVPLVGDAKRFVAETRVLPLKVLDFKVDVIFGGLPYEKRAIERAKRMDLGSCRVRVCSPEDLIVQKIISERPRDREDVLGIMRKNGKSLDRSYLEPILRQLALELAKPDIWESYLRGLGGT